MERYRNCAPKMINDRPPFDYILSNWFDDNIACAQHQTQDRKKGLAGSCAILFFWRTALRIASHARFDCRQLVRRGYVRRSVCRTGSRPRALQ
jgi:hypothetical protein